MNKGDNHMVYKIIKIMAFLILISALISFFNIYDFNKKFSSTIEDASDLEKYDYHFIAIVPENKGKSIHLLTQGARKADKEFNIVTEIYTANSRNEQLEIIKIAQLAQVDGIILWPISNSGYKDAINDSVGKGIPVVLVSVDSPNSNRNSFIGLGRSSAKMAVAELMNAIQGKGEICILSHQLNHSDYDVRIEEFTQFANKYHSITTKLFFLKDENYLNEVDQIKNIISDNPQVTAIFCLNSEITVEAASALKLLNKQDILVMGYDDFKKSEEFILNSELYGIIFENAEFMGYVAVRYLRDINRGKWVQEVLDPGIKLMTKESLDAFKK